MKMHRSVLAIVAASAITAACGGGGGESADTSTGTTVPASLVPPKSKAETTLTDGLLTITGAGSTINGVDQKAISRTSATAASSGMFNVSAAVAVGPTGMTPVSAFDTLDTAAYWSLTQSGWTSSSFSYQVQYAQDETIFVAPGGVALGPARWTMKLNLQDVGGKPASDYLLDAAGKPLLASFVPTELPAGVMAAFPSFAPTAATVITSIFGDLDPLLATEADLYTRKYCEQSKGSSARIEYQVAAGGVLKVWDATAGCGASATPVADGQWQTQTLQGKTVYLLTFPTTVQYENFSAYVPASAFAQGAMRAIVAGSSTERWKMGYFIPKDVAIQSKRPFLTNTALEAIRKAASL